MGYDLVTLGAIAACDSTKLGKKMYRYGPLNIDISGEGSLRGLICEEFVESNLTKDIDICIIFNQKPEKYREDVFSGKSSLHFNNEIICINRSPFFSIYIENLFSKYKTVRVYIVEKSAPLQYIAESYIKALFSAQNDSIVKTIKSEIMSYKYMLSILSICLIKKGACFIHAGIFSSDERRYIVTGTGGCGKTSSVLYNCNLGFKYYAEDFGIICSEGKVYYSPKSITLFKSDMDYYPKLERDILKKRPLLTRVKWNFLTRILNRNTFLKVFPTELFNVGEGDSLNVECDFIYMRRENKDTTDIMGIDSLDVARRASLAAIREMSPFLEIICGIEANKKNNTNIYSYNRILNEVENIIKSYLDNSNVNKFILTTSLNMPPKKIMDKIHNGNLSK